MEDTSKDRAIVYFNMAEEKLISSKIDLSGNRLRTSASNLYYAMFNAATAIVVRDGHVPSTHKFVISYVNKNYCNTGRLPREFGSLLKKAEEIRLEADYDPDFNETAEFIGEWVIKAENYVAVVRSLFGTGKMNLF